MFGRQPLLPLVLLFSFVLGGAGCDGDQNEDPPVCPGEPELTRVTVPETAAVGATITIAFEVENFEFSHEAGHDHDHFGLQPNPEVKFRAVDPISAETGCYVGHVHVYADDLMSNPIAQITEESADVELPATLLAGEHTFIYRLHDASHLIIEPQVIVEKTITIE